MHGGSTAYRRCRARLLACWFLGLAAPGLEGVFALEAPFRRGDANDSGRVDISDAIATLGCLFLGRECPACEDAADANDDGVLDISDAVTLLRFLFSGGLEPPSPGPASCGTDGTADPLPCVRSSSCATGVPLLTEVTPTLTLRHGDAAAVDFSWADADGDIAALHAARHNALGDAAYSVPAALLGLRGEAGRSSLGLDSRQLPFGETLLELQLEDDAGNRSASAPVRIEVVGEAAGGAAPAVTGFAALTSAWRRPAGRLDRLRPRFRIACADADGDIARARLERRFPDGTATIEEIEARRLGIPGPGGAAERTFFAFDAESPPGSYRMELTLFDRRGNASARASAAVELLAAAGASPAIIGFAPATGAAGTEVVIDVTGLDPVLESHRIDLGDVPLEIVAAGATSLTVRVREGAGTAPFVLRTPDADVVSAVPFTVPAAILLEPSSLAATVGAATPLRATVISAPPGELIWSVDGVPGGGPTTGTVAADGTFTAPAALPPGGTVEIAATLASDPAVRGQLRATILPPPPTPGAARVLAAAGATVFSLGRRAAVVIPPGALPADAVVSVAHLQGEDAPPPAAGRSTLGAVELGPSPLALIGPATVVVPLARPLPPGTTLALRSFTAASQTYADAGLATVLETGEQAAGPIGAFSTLLVDEPAAGGGGACAAPATLGLEPASGLEGTQVPVRLTGATFPEGITANVSGTGVLAGAVYGSGETAGLVLSIGTLSDLGAGSSRTYTVDVFDGSCNLGTASFTVAGLAELHVPAGETRDVDDCGEPPPLYSRIDIDGTLRLRPGVAGTLCLQATGPVRIDGAIDARGTDGAGGAGTVCGGLDPPDADPEDFCGRAPGVVDGRGGYGREEDGDPDPEAFGAAGAAPPRGAPGGAPGNNIDLNSLLQDVVSFGTNAAACVGSEGSDVFACKAAVEAGIDIGESVASFIEGPLGRPGMGGPLGERGGGGGGAGRFESPPIAGPVGFAINGGGGGAGGLPGNQIRLLTPDDITINGRVTADGGKGGDGSATGELRVVADFLFVEASFAVADVPAFSGGSGGGGSGGRVRLIAGSGLWFSSSPQAQATSAGGVGGVGTGPASAGRPRNPGLSDPRTFGDMPYFSTGLQGFVQTGSFVTTRTLVRVALRDPSGLGGAFRVRGEGSAAWTSFPAAYDAATGTTSANLVLAPGFNVLAGIEPLLDTTILVLGEDADGDGLSDADEAELGTDPRNPDTDGDGLGDGDELRLTTDPLLRDTDGDGLDDGGDPTPLRRDGDEDGVWDGAEVVLGTAPADFFSRPAQLPGDFIFAAVDGHLAIVQPRTGAIGLLGLVHGGADFALAFDAARTLYVTRGASLATADPLDVDAQGNVATVPVGPPGLGSGVACLAFNRQDGMLYGIAATPGRDRLLSIDRATGAATLVGTAPRSIRSLVFDPYGSLFAAADDGASDLLLEMDASTADLYEIGPIGFAPVPGMAMTRYGEILASQPLAGGASHLLSIADPYSGDGGIEAIVPRRLGAIALSPPPCEPRELGFDPPGGFALPGVPESLEVADWNGDQTLDLATVIAAGIIDVRLGNGDGTFRVGPSVPVAGGLRSLATGDLDDDGDLDLVTVSTAADQVHVLRGAGDGSFAAAETLAPTAEVEQVVVGDLDRDGDPDLLTVSHDPGALDVFRNDGPGAFSGPASRAVGTSLSGAVLADIDRDHDLDVAVMAYAGAGPLGYDGAVYVLRNDGTGGLGAPAEHVLEGNHGGLIGAADLDVDGDPDLLAWKLERFDLNDPSQDATLEAFENGGAGAFLPAVLQFGYANLGAFAARDLDGNAFPDVAIGIAPHACCTGGSVAVLPNDCTGLLDCDLTLACSYLPIPTFLVTGMAAGDFDGDGDGDIAAAHSDTLASGVAVFLNVTPP